VKEVKKIPKINAAPAANFLYTE